MKNRVSRCVTLIGTVLSLSSFAQVCNEVTLYEGGESGIMENVGGGNSFPESPEWNANWGERGNLVPPYIRLSGRSSVAGNWTGTMIFDRMPLSVQGGNLSMDVFVTRASRVGVWLEGDFGSGSVHYVDVGANVPNHIEVPVQPMIRAGDGLVQKLGIGLFDVPADNYVTFFIDNVKLSCAPAGEISFDENADGGNISVDYPFSDVDPSSPRRESRFKSSPATETSAAYDSLSRLELRNSSQADFALDYQEHLRIETFSSASDLMPEDSRKGWFGSMYLLERNRLRDSVMANPKTLFYEAAEFSAGYENRVMPLLIGNVDYAYRVCADTSCETSAFEKGQALMAGLPSSAVYGSVLELVYDPYFVATNRKSLPSLEIHDGNRWAAVPLKSKIRIEFDSAGLQKICVRLVDGGKTVTQYLSVEVK